MTPGNFQNFLAIAADIGVMVLLDGNDYESPHGPTEGLLALPHHASPLKEHRNVKIMTKITYWKCESTVKVDLIYFFLCINYKMNIQ